jgi:hypothetical protein
MSHVNDDGDIFSYSAGNSKAQYMSNNEKEGLKVTFYYFIVSQLLKS